MQNPSLYVYTASAGAGKTHTLTGRYLELALSSSDAFRHIQAVTFTNKATAEMKERIVSELYNLAYAPDQSAFSTELISKLGYSQDKLQEQAAVVLREILHDYSSFRVKTIDAFFQEVTRSFARELGLSGTYRIALEEAVVLDQAVTRLLGKLSEEETESDTNRWITRLTEEEIQKGKGHNIKRILLSLGKEIFKEDLKQITSRGDLPSKEDISRFGRDINRLMDDFTIELRAIATEALDIIARHGLEVTSFAYGKTSAMNEFAKISAGADPIPPGKRFTDAAHNPDKLTAKSAPPPTRAAIEAALAGGLEQCMTRLLLLFEKSYPAFNTAREAVKLLPRYGLIADIYKEVQEIEKEQNMMLISDAPTLIHRIIAGSDIPFIYEKIGNRLNHQMIDEFQDTSRMQYHNFLPLLTESLAQGHDNLIVGDVKQSIYRFRNSDSSLLSSAVEQDFVLYAKPETLQQNWRSCKEIIEFNNALYQQLPALLTHYFHSLITASIVPEAAPMAEIFKQAYREAPQLLPESKADYHGAVRIHKYSVHEAVEGDADLCALSDDLITSDDVTVLPGERQIVCAQVARTVIDIQRRGFKPSDIAILVRDKAQAQLIAQALLMYERMPEEMCFSMDVISAEALRIDRSYAVRLVVSAMRYINAADDTMTRYILGEAYGSLVRLSHPEVVSPQIPEDHYAVLLEYGRKSLYETAEGVVALFNEYIPEEETSYILRLLDLVNDFQFDLSADIASFLVWWDQTGHRETIVSPDSDRAISLMTVHKSKGLGFPVVLMPFANWPVGPKANFAPILWCDLMGRAPFDNLPVIPVGYVAELANTYFAKDYFREQILTAQDNLNLLYVATTRAKQELHIWLNDDVQPAPDAKLTSIDLLLHRALDDVDACVPYTVTDEQQGIEDAYPPYTFHEAHEEEDMPGIVLDKIRSYSLEDRLSILFEGRSFFREDSPRKHGRTMHRILSAVETYHDLQASLDKAVSDGLITDDDALDLQAELEELMTAGVAAPWFDGSGTVLSEAPIIGGEIRGIRRPDRVILYPDQSAVVVDYKFGEEHGAHRRQVKAYATLLSDMGYAPVRGFLWYVAKGVVKEV
ncbi:UvrD-helicase domain-containing protein [Porphyromonas pogonae]|uniref:UvrD-helicase domain-containing protein n=1 Tax=Porphyromonas pogonae TaxID=867595 RepID=UPI002E76FD09|nr:UvrD-helicase domain-containing protein [Porphyromonas pogonae]